MRRNLVSFFVLFLMAGIMTAGCKSSPKTVFDPSKAVKTDAGFVDAVEPLKVASGAAIHAGGWAADLKAAVPANDIVVLSDGNQIPFEPKIGISRPDVAKALNNAALEKSGWDGSIPAASLGKGKHKLEFYAVLSNQNFAVLHYGSQMSCEVEVTE